MSSIEGIAHALQAGVEMLGEVVKEKTQLKVEQAKNNMEMQKKKTEVVIKAGEVATETGGKIIGKVVDILAENQKKRVDMQVEAIKTDNEIKRSEADEELSEKRARFEKEMEELAKDRDLQRRKNVLEAIQRYQVEVTKTVDESMILMAKMPLSVVEETQHMLDVEIDRYSKLQKEWKDEALEKSIKIETAFANNEEMKKRWHDMIMDDTQRMIQMATDTIARMGADVKRINNNAIRFSEDGKQVVNEALGKTMLNGSKQYFIQTDKSE